MKLTYDACSVETPEDDDCIGGKKNVPLSKKINSVAVLIGGLRVIKSLSLLCNSLSKYH